MACSLHQQAPHGRVPSMQLRTFLGASADPATPAAPPPPAALAASPGPAPGALPGRPEPVDLPPEVTGGRPLRASLVRIDSAGAAAVNRAAGANGHRPAALLLLQDAELAAA